MGRRECKNCGNAEPGTTIYSCKSCGQVYCSECLPNSGCGNCDKEWFPGVLSTLPFMPDNLKTLGEIEDDTDADADE